MQPDKPRRNSLEVQVFDGHRPDAWSPRSANKKMNQLDLRTATEADQGTIFSIHEQLFREHIDQIWGWDDQWQMEHFLNDWEQVSTITIHEAGRLVGYVQTRDAEDHVYVLGLGIYPQYQKRGIGSEIMDRLKSRNDTLRLSVFRTNNRALQFYLRIGFRITEETETGFKLQWEPLRPNQTR